MAAQDTEPVYTFPLSTIAEKCTLGIVAMSSARRRPVSRISTSLSFCQNAEKAKGSLTTNYSTNAKRLNPALFASSFLTVSTQINELYQERMLFSNMNTDVLIGNIIPYSNTIDYIQILTHFRAIIRQRASVDPDISDDELIKNITTTLNVAYLIHNNVMERNVLLHACPSCSTGRLLLSTSESGQTIQCNTCEGHMLDSSSGNVNWSFHNLDKLLTQIDSAYGFQVGVDCVELNNYTAQTHVESLLFVTPYRQTHASKAVPDDGRYREKHIDPYMIPKRLTHGSRWQPFTFYPIAHSHKKPM